MSSRTRNRTTKWTGDSKFSFIIGAAGLGTLAAVLRIIPLLRSNLSFALRPDDSFEYLQLAAGLRHGCGFARLLKHVCQQPEILRTPGYPIVLAMLPGLRLPLVMQGLAGGVVCFAAMMFIASRWRIAAAIFAGALIAFDIPSMVMSSELMSETLFQFVAFFAVMFLLISLRAKDLLIWAVLSGIAISYAIMVRPIAIFLPLIAPIPFLLNTSVSLRYRAAAAFVAFGICVAAVGSWSFRNYEETGYAGLSSVGAINLYYYRAADVIARHDRVLLEAERASFGAALGVPYDRIYDANVQSAATTARMHRLAVNILRQNVLTTIMMTAQSTAYLALAPIRSPLARMLGTSGGSEGNGLAAGALSASRVDQIIQAVRQSYILTVLVIFQIIYMVVLWVGVIKALARTWYVKGDYRYWIWYLCAISVFLLIPAAGGEADVRFRAPVIPFLSIVAALGYFFGSEQLASERVETQPRHPLIATNSEEDARIMAQ